MVSNKQKSVKRGQCLTTNEVVDQMKAAKEASTQKSAAQEAKKQRARINSEIQEEAKRKTAENKRIRAMRKVVQVSLIKFY